MTRDGGAVNSDCNTMTQAKLPENTKDVKRLYNWEKHHLLLTRYVNQFGHANVSVVVMLRVRKND